MELSNTTQFTDQMVRKVLRFVSGKRGYTKYVDSLVVNPAEPGTRWRGVCKPYVGDIRLWVAKAYRFPYTRPPMSGGYIEVNTRSDIEALVYVTAHEFRHIWQTTHYQRLGGGRKGLSERDVDTFAVQAIAKWRKRRSKLKLAVVYTPETRRRRRKKGS